MKVTAIGSVSILTINKRLASRCLVLMRRRLRVKCLFAMLAS